MSVIIKIEVYFARGPSGKLTTSLDCIRANFDRNTFSFLRGARAFSEMCPNLANYDSTHSIIKIQSIISDIFFTRYEWQQEMSAMLEAEEALIFKFSSFLPHAPVGSRRCLGLCHV